MATVIEKAPNTIVLEFRQEKGIDPDYGSCLWAVFTFDLERYSMTIMSDCGNYAYGWGPTPQSEGFMHLMARIDRGYLLDKIAKRNNINTPDTFKAVESLINKMGIDTDKRDRYGSLIIDMEEIKSACQHDTERDVYDALKGEFNGTRMDDCDDYDIWCCIVTDYSANALKIAQIFEDYIKPKCKEIDERIVLL